MNKLPLQKRAQILSMLVEGSSMRSVSRVCDVSINTVTKLLIDAGTMADTFQDQVIRGLKTTQLQCDEIWAFCQAKQRNRETMKRPSMEAGDVWTFTALDRDSKLIVSWYSGARDTASAHAFLKDTASRIDTPVQVNTDGFQAYTNAQSLEPASPEWRRLRKKHDLLATRYRMAREMSAPRSLN